MNDGSIGQEFCTENEYAHTQWDGRLLSGILGMITHLQRPRGEVGEMEILQKKQSHK